jgi:hypothetical protein
MAAMDRDFSVSTESGGSSNQSPFSNVSFSPENKITLHLGVIDIPYVNAPSQQKVAKAKKGKNARPIKPKVESGTQTTGDVAGWLESKYGVMQTFVEQQIPGIAVELEESLAGALENLMMGAQPSGNPFASATSNITQMFKTYLAEGEIEHAGVAGVPTEAALKGVNHRLKLNRGPRRPSFIDTGLYQQSFIAWIE